MHGHMGRGQVNLHIAAWKSRRELLLHAASAYAGSWPAGPASWKPTSQMWRGLIQATAKQSKLSADWATSESEVLTVNTHTSNIEAHLDRAHASMMHAFQGASSRGSARRQVPPATQPVRISPPPAIRVPTHVWPPPAHTVLRIGRNVINAHTYSWVYMPVLAWVLGAGDLQQFAFFAPHAQQPPFSGWITSMAAHLQTRYSFGHSPSLLPSVALVYPWACAGAAA